MRIESAFNLAVSIVRLREATSTSVFQLGTNDFAKGTVAQHKVVLQRVIPMVGNSFKPIFVGRFEDSDGRAVLVGHFTMHWFTKLFMTVWFFGLLYVAVMVARKGDAQWWEPPFIFGFMLAGIAVVRLFKWLSRTDEVWLTNFLNQTLTDNHPENRHNG